MTTTADESPHCESAETQDTSQPVNVRCWPSVGRSASIPTSLNLGVNSYADVIASHQKIFERENYHQRHSSILQSLLLSIHWTKSGALSTQITVPEHSESGRHLGDAIRKCLA